MYSFPCTVQHSPSLNQKHPFLTQWNISLYAFRCEHSQRDSQTWNWFEYNGCAKYGERRKFPVDWMWKVKWDLLRTLLFTLIQNALIAENMIFHFMWSLYNSVLRTPCPEASTNWLSVSNKIKVFFIINLITFAFVEHETSSNNILENCNSVSKLLNHITSWMVAMRWKTCL